MICEKCKSKMVYACEDSVEGWLCHNCGFEILTSHIDNMAQDMKEYSVYIMHTDNIDKDKIKLVSQIAGVNFIDARRMLLSSNSCILKAKAIEVKRVANQLRKAGIPFKVIPQFNYL